MMNLGYRHPLYLLPFDHRDSYVSEMFHLKPPLSKEQRETVALSKQLIYDGFCHAQNDALPRSYTGILVDEEYGTSVLRAAIKQGYTTALSVEKSGSAEFQFEYGEAYWAHIAEFKPTFAKVLVRYNPEGDECLNQRQAKRLKELSDKCREKSQRFMFELLVPATHLQLERVDMIQEKYDRFIRPTLMCEAIQALQDAGVEPDVWKIEGLDTREDCEQIVDVVQRDGRDDVACIVLGRGADADRVVSWLETAAAVKGFVGFAVGRTTFWNAVADYEAKLTTRQEAISYISRRFQKWTAIFEKARKAHEDIPNSQRKTKMQINRA